ncbi:MAG: D-alanyl-D-alanine carboxypeptidase [Acidobacteria bacterium]|nr:D-alanyl-D-alanine carboxypeptidase [Acidobacteriota bacterium]
MMKSYLLPTTSLIFLLFWPIQAQEIATSDTPGAAVLPRVPERLNTISETNYLNALALRGFKLQSQGLLIESLDARTVYADLNSDTGFNPASVIKVATSFAALSKLGPEHRFETSFHTDGAVNLKTKTLTGNLVLRATGDPILTANDVTRLVREVARGGIAKVTGKLVVAGPFTFGNSLTTDRAIKGLSTTLRRVGIRVSGTARDPAVRGSKVASHVSSTLRDILFYQNAHSVNTVAERLGEALGGPKAIEEFLVKAIGLSPADIYISRTSGLDFNRITPRGAVQLLRELVYWLNLQNLQPRDILPVAGVDVGTLRRRFTSEEYRGAIIGKTGTLNVTDGGVSTLAGIVYTRDRGPVLFAIFNTRGSVNTYRKLQDDFMKAFIGESGGIPEVNASLHRIGN